MDQGLNALDMISKFTRDEPLVKHDSAAADADVSEVSAFANSEASPLGRKAGIISTAK